MTMLPLPACTSSLKVSTMSSPRGTSLASSAGVLEDKVGAVVSTTKEGLLPTGPWPRSAALPAASAMEPPFRSSALGRMLMPLLSLSPG